MNVLKDFKDNNRIRLSDISRSKKIIRIKISLIQEISAKAGKNPGHLGYNHFYLLEYSKVRELKIKRSKFLIMTFHR